MHRRVRVLLWRSFPSATARIVDATQKGGFDFLGYHFERGYKWPRKKSLEKFKETIRQKTTRLRSGGMEEIIKDLNRSITGWYNYFRQIAGTTFKPLDGWIRRRLRGT